MREAAEIKPRDVSKSLFMDLAFLLIATLLLLVNEPAKQSKFQAAFIETRRTPVSKVEEKDLSGESIFLEVQSNGKLSEIIYNGSRKELATETISKRIDQMTQYGERVVVFFFEPDTPYAKVNSVLDEITKMQQVGKIDKVYENVRMDN